MINFSLDIEDFSGPLDLLLHLVKESKKDILEVDMSEIIKKYLEFINMQESLNIEISSEYLTIATELIHIKSKKLLNLDNDTEEESEIFTSEEDLRKRLIEYNAYKNVTVDFENLFNKRNEVYTKGVTILDDFKEQRLSEGSLNELILAFKEVIKRQKFLRPLEAKVTKNELSVEKRSKQIKNILEKEKKINFFDLFNENDKPNLVVTFLSILEMSKSGILTIKQTKNFDNITIESRITNG